MDELLDRKFLNTIVFINDFKLDFRSLQLNILCIEGEDTEVNYVIELFNVSYFVFSQEDFDFEFSVIDTFLERFNESSKVESMRSERIEDYWQLRFHSGTHDLIVRFQSLKLSEIEGGK